MKITVLPPAPLGEPEPVRGYKIDPHDGAYTDSYDILVVQKARNGPNRGKWDSAHLIWKAGARMSIQDSQEFYQALGFALELSKHMPLDDYDPLPNAVDGISLT